MLVREPDNVKEAMTGNLRPNVTAIPQELIARWIYLTT
jgi:hypothetical protein